MPAKTLFLSEVRFGGLGGREVLETLVNPACRGTGNFSAWMAAGAIAVVQPGTGDGGRSAKPCQGPRGQRRWVVGWELLRSPGRESQGLRARDGLPAHSREFEAGEAGVVSVTITQFM